MDKHACVHTHTHTQESENKIRFKKKKYLKRTERKLLAVKMMCE